MSEYTIKALEDLFVMVDDCLKKSDIGICLDQTNLNDYLKKIYNNNDYIDKLDDDDKKKLINELTIQIPIYIKAAENLSQDDSKKQTEEAILRAKENWVTAVLEEYFKQWILEGSDESGNYVTVPYFMEGNSSNKNFKDTYPTIVESIKSIKSKREKERSDKPNGTNYDFQVYDKDDDYLLGKSFPDVYKDIYEKLKIIEHDKDIQTLMKKNYGIGVDCSGFVSRALATIFEKLQSSSTEQVSSLGESDEKKDIYDVRVRTNMDHYDGEIKKVRLKKCENGVWKYDNKKAKVAVKCDRMRPGDFLKSKVYTYWESVPNDNNVYKHKETGHVRIISCVSRDENITFTVMESASSKGKNGGVVKTIEAFKQRNDNTYTYHYSHNVIDLKRNPKRIAIINKKNVIDEFPKLDEENNSIVDKSNNVIKKRDGEIIEIVKLKKKKIDGGQTVMVDKLGRVILDKDKKQVYNKGTIENDNLVVSLCKFDGNMSAKLEAGLVDYYGNVIKYVQEIVGKDKEPRTKSTDYYLFRSPILIDFYGQKVDMD